jgi:glycine cleavage system regulatory protein
MIAHILLTVIADDQPGVVERLANTIHRHQGNWQDSQLAHLQGKFAGIISVALDSSSVDAFLEGLGQLQASGYSIAHQFMDSAAPAEPEASLELSIMGPDRKGIVQEVSSALAKRAINLLDLTSSCSSMPWSGEPMFVAHGRILLPEGSDTDELTDQLAAIADELGVDVQLDEPETNT